MEIPYTVSARPDTGLYSGKIGIWLFLASEVMLFAGLFSSYVFLRIGAEPGLWPHGLLNVPIGTLNTFILIASSVTIVLAWAALKMRQFSQYQLWMATTIILGVVFLIIKLGYEYPQKFNHFGVYIKPDLLPKYEEYLGNNHLASKGLSPRVEITGHLHSVVVDSKKADAGVVSAFLEKHHLESLAEEGGLNVISGEHLSPGTAESLAKIPNLKVEAFEMKIDPVNGDPNNAANDHPQFFQKPASEKEITIPSSDIRWASAFVPKHSSFFAVYFTITGLHALHIVGGLVVFLYFLGPGASLYKKNPEYLANRVECVGLFWHLVDLVWIFAFPLFYLL